MEFSFQTIFIIYVIILNTLIVTISTITGSEDPRGGLGIFFGLNFFLVVIPILVIHFFF